MGYASNDGHRPMCPCHECDHRPPAPAVTAVPADPVRELVCNSVGYHLPHGWHNGPGTPRYRCPGNLNPCLCGHHEVDHVAGEHGHQCGACGCESFAPTPVPADPNEKD